MSDEAPGGGAGGEVPEAELTIPGTRQRELPVGAERDVLDEVRMPGEAAERRRVGPAWIGADRRRIVRDFPEEKGLVTRGGDEEVGAVQRGGDGRDHVAVAPHRAHLDQCLRHC